MSFPEWYWGPIFATPIVLALSMIVGVVIALTYGLFFLIRKTFQPHRTYRFVTKKKIVVLLLLIAVADVPLFTQYGYFGRHRSNPDSYPCERVACLDNYFPVTIPASEVDTSGIDFKVYLPSPPPEGFTQRFLEISPSDLNVSRDHVKNQASIVATYRRGDSSFVVTETRSTSSVGPHLGSRFGAPQKTPMGRAVYQGGNTLAATVVDNTVIYIGHYYTNSDAPLSPMLAGLVDSLKETPVTELVFKPKGRRR